jgi:ABC-type protease/lipase transport system fused ATPase/permease subunit
MNDEKQLHWLVRPSTIRKLWIGTSVVLTLIVLAQTVIYVKGYFGFDAWFGFGAVYGFVSCLVMVLLAKLLGLVLKRPIDYYDELKQPETADSTHKNVKESSNGV